MSEPRSYHVLYWAAQVFSLASAIVFAVAAAADTPPSAWWFVALVPAWGCLIGWRLVARRWQRSLERERDELLAEVMREVGK